MTEPASTEPNGYKPGESAIPGAPLDVPSGWLPTADVTDHLGQPLARDADFFAPPPRQIGTPISASTSLRLGQRPYSVPVRLMWVIVAAAGTTVVAAVAFALLLTPPKFASNPVFQLIAGGIGLAGGGIGYLCTGFSHTCSYIGESGLALWTCRGRRDNLGSPKLLMFEKATDLRFKIVKRFVNGIYQGTDYTYTWSDGKRPVFVQSGTFNESSVGPSDLFHFARGGELAWARYILPAALQKIQEDGILHFPLTGRDSLGIGVGFLEVNKGGRVERVETAELATAQFINGALEIRLKGAKKGWFSTSGVYTFEVAAMSNLRLFEALFSRLVVPEWGPNG